MKYIEHIIGDVFELADQNGGAAVIGTNCTVNGAGLAVMGRGAAKQASELYPGLRIDYGYWLRNSGVNPVHTPRGDCYRDMATVRPYVSTLPPRSLVYCFTVKYGWWEHANLALIDIQARHLAQWMGENDSINVFLTRVGCGNGKLSWEIVEPILAKHLDKEWYAGIYLVDQKEMV